MGDLFKALSSGIARFVYAWIVPSAITSGAYLLVVLPQLRKGPVDLTLGGAAAFTLVVITLSVIFAYAARPMYQFLEGYTMPPWLSRPLVRRSQAKWLRLKAIAQVAPPVDAQYAKEKLKAYPDKLTLIMPTSLGNALKAMEGFGDSRYGLDSQTFWYELQAVADDKVASSTAETRAAVDFFMSSIVHLVMLAITSALSLIAAEHKWPLLVLSAVCLALVPVAYRQAVLNVGEWRWAVQALVNTSRPALAAALSLRLPDTFDDERAMWQGVSGLVHHGPHEVYFDILDPLRVRAPSSRTTAVRGSDGAKGSSEPPDEQGRGAGGETDEGASQLDED